MIALRSRRNSSARSSKCSRANHERAATDAALDLADDIALIAENVATIARTAIVGWSGALARVAELEATIDKAGA